MGQTWLTPGQRDQETRQRSNKDDGANPIKLFELHVDAAFLLPEGDGQRNGNVRQCTEGEVDPEEPRPGVLHKGTSHQRPEDTANGPVERDEAEPFSAFS